MCNGRKIAASAKHSSCQRPNFFRLLYCIFRQHRSITYVDVACYYGMSSMVCRSVILVSSAKIAEPFEMPFGLRTQVGPRNHVLDQAQILHVKGQLLGETTCPDTPDDTLL